MKYVVVFAVGLIGCSSVDPPNTVRGTVLGQSLMVNAVASARIPQPEGQAYAEIILSTSASLCDDAAAGGRSANQTLIDILVANNTPTAQLPPSATGAYPVGGMPFRSVVIVRSYGSECQLVTDPVPAASSGDVELSAISGDTFAGTFDVTLSTQDHITGSFDPSPCENLVKIAAGSTVACL